MVLLALAQMVLLEWLPEQVRGPMVAGLLAMRQRPERLVQKQQHRR
jgi:hypothetical protein